MPDSNKGLAKKEQFINNLFAYIKLTFPIQGSFLLYMPDSNKGLAKKEQFINNLFAYIKLTFPIQGRGSFLCW
jgi:hypothetical protein